MVQTSSEIERRATLAAPDKDAAADTPSAQRSDPAPSPTHMTDEQLLERPIIVLGSPRSGTTFLGQLISRHRDVKYCVEPRLTWKYGNDGKSDFLTVDDARPNVVEHIRRSFANMVREEGRTRLAEKTPSNSIRPEFVEKVFPDARYIHIIRNGVDSALSIRSFWEGATHGIKRVASGRMSQRRAELQWWRVPYYWREILRRFAPAILKPYLGQNHWGPRLPGMEQMVRDVGLMGVCCMQWRMCVELSCQFGRQLPADRYFECRLEDLTVDTVRDLLAFARLDDDPQVIEHFEQSYNPNLSGGRKSAADPEQVAEILRWIEPTMRWLGYDTPDGSDQPTPTDSTDPANPAGAATGTDG